MGGRCQIFHTVNFQAPSLVFESFEWRCFLQVLHSYVLYRTLCMKFSIRCPTAANSFITIIGVTSTFFIDHTCFTSRASFSSFFFCPFLVTNRVDGRTGDIYGPVLFVVFVHHQGNIWFHDLIEPLKPLGSWQRTMPLFCVSFCLKAPLSFSLLHWVSPLQSSVFTSSDLLPSNSNGSVVLLMYNIVFFCSHTAFRTNQPSTSFFP